MTTTVELTQIVCGNCGGVYAISDRFHTKCRANGESWTCPYCKVGWGYSGIGELDDLRRRLARQESRANLLAADLTTTRRQLIAQRGVTTRVKNSIAKGKCPCCRREFRDLALHMKVKHPEFGGAS